MKAREGEIRAEITRRILALKREGESDSAFAGRIGLTPAAISNYRQGNNTAGLTAILAVLDGVPEADARELLTGKKPGAPSIKEARYGLMEKVLAGKMDKHIAGEIGPGGRVTGKIGDEGLKETNRRKVKQPKNGE